MSTENTQQQQGEDKNKEAKKFSKNFKRLVGLFSGETIFKRNTLDSTQVTQALEKLVKEDRENLEKEFIEGARKLIKRKRDFDAFEKAEREKMDKAVLEKKKEFNKEMESLFSLVDKIENIEKSYYETLTDLSTEPSTNTAEPGSNDGNQNS